MIAASPSNNRVRSSRSMARHKIRTEIITVPRKSNWFIPAYEIIAPPPFTCPSGPWLGLRWSRKMWKSSTRTLDWPNPNHPWEHYRETASHKTSFRWPGECCQSAIKFIVHPSTSVHSILFCSYFWSSFGFGLMWTNDMLYVHWLLPQRGGGGSHPLPWYGRTVAGRGPSLFNLWNLSVFPRAHLSTGEIPTGTASSREGQFSEELLRPFRR